MVRQPLEFKGHLESSSMPKSERRTSSLSNLPIHTLPRQGSNSTVPKNMGEPRRWFSLFALALLAAGLILFIVILLTPLPHMEEDISGVDLTNGSEVDQNEVGSTELLTSTETWTTEQAKTKMVEVAIELSTNFPSDPNAYHVAGMIYAELKQTKKGEEAWRKCLDLKPNGVGPYVGLATLLIDRGEETEAIELLESVRSSGRKSAELFQTLANGLTQQGELERADGVVKEGIRTFPGDPPLWLQLGLIEMQRQQFSAAESSFRKAIEHGDCATSTLNALTTALSRQGKLDEVKILQAELETRKRAGKADSSGSFQTEYEDAIRMVASPNLKLAAAVARANNRMAIAENWLLQAMAMAPEDASILMELSSLYRQMNRGQDALIVHQKLLQMQPRNVLNYTNLASVATQMGRVELAEAVLIEAAVKFPDIAFPCGELARLGLAQRNFRAARQWSEKAWTIEPQNVEWHLMGAIASKELGDIEKMTMALQRAREIAPSDVRVRDFMQGKK